MLFRRLLGGLPGHHERRGRRDLRPRAPPHRQELAFTLFRYAKEAGLDTKVRADLTPYSDAGQVAGWAGRPWNGRWPRACWPDAAPEAPRPLPRWAPVTRAEFSAVLKTLCETVLPKQ